MQVDRTLGAPRDLLLLAGEILGRNRPAKPIARLQTLPIGGHCRTEFPGQSEAFRQQQRISDGDIGGGKAARAQYIAAGERGLDPAQPAQEPLV